MDPASLFISPVIGDITQLYWLVPIITRLVTKQAKSWYHIAIGVMGTILGGSIEKLQMDIFSKERFYSTSGKVRGMILK